MKCPNSIAVQTLFASFDRLNEAEWHVQQMQENYHNAAKLRWSLSSFLRAIKEVSQIISMEIQQNKTLKAWYKNERKTFLDDPIVSYLSKQRDVVVHQTMLKPSSTCSVCVIRGRRIKIGLGMPINPLFDSEEAILKYIDTAVEEDSLGVLCTDSDSDEFTCVMREWKLSEFPDHEITELASHTWETIGKVLVEIGRKLGADFIEPKIRISPLFDVQLEIYPPDWIKSKLEAAGKVYSEQIDKAIKEM